MTTVVSIHAPREGCDFDYSERVKREFVFQFTHPGRGATITDISLTLGDIRFNSRTPGGVRRVPGLDLFGVIKFQFTHPGRGATILGYAPRYCEYVSIHAPREGCDLNRRGPVIHTGNVSIHAPREGCDPSTPLPSAPFSVSIHAPREGCDLSKTLIEETQGLFQFTHPGRGATWLYIRTTKRPRRFNSRTPGGVRPYRGAP